LERAEALKGIALPVTSPNTENVRGLNSIQEDSSPTDGNLCLHHLRQLKFKSAIFFIKQIKRLICLNPLQIVHPDLHCTEAIAPTWL
jgi:hypothetical protein